MANRVQALYNQVMLERRILLCCTIIVGLSVCVWILAATVDHWVRVEMPEGLTSNETFHHRDFGLWTDCTVRVIRLNVSSTTNSTSISTHKTVEDCKRLVMFPPDKKVKPEDVEETVLNYWRSRAAFSVICLFVMLLGVGFSIYAWLNPRYTFKRLAGGIHFISALCIMVVIQVLLSAIEFEKRIRRFPKGVEENNGISIILAWIVFGCNATAGCAFMLFSKKRKRGKAPNDDMAMADEPTIIGR